MRLEQVVTDDSTKESATVLSCNVQEAEETAELASVASEHEGECDGRVEVGARNASAEDQKNEEAAEQTNESTCTCEGRVEECCEEHRAKEFKEKDQK